MMCKHCGQMTINFRVGQVLISTETHSKREKGDKILVQRLLLDYQYEVEGIEYKNLRTSVGAISRNLCEFKLDKKERNLPSWF